VNNGLLNWLLISCVCFGLKDLFNIKKFLRKVLLLFLRVETCGVCLEDKEHFYNWHFN